MKESGFGSVDEKMNDEDYPNTHLKNCEYIHFA